MEIKLSLKDGILGISLQLARWQGPYYGGCKAICSETKSSSTFGQLQQAGSRAVFMYMTGQCCRQHLLRVFHAAWLCGSKCTLYIEVQASICGLTSSRNCCCSTVCTHCRRATDVGQVLAQLEANPAPEVVQGGFHGVVAGSKRRHLDAGCALLLLIVFFLLLDINGCSRLQ